MFVFSIIIPVFNTEISHFSRCLESIKNNDLDKNKFEVIIINDGMKDFNEYNKIIEKALTSNNIKNKIIHNSLNMRQGYSRYVGLKVAKGDYVHFVDSDDEIFHHTYTTLINYLKDEPNFILFKVKSILDGAEGVQQDYVMDYLINGINKDILQDYIFSKKDTKKIRGMFIVLYSKIFNRLWLLENTELYIPNLYLEDLLLSFEYLLKTEKFKVCLDKLYRYHYFNDGSTMSKGNNKLFFDSLFVFDKIFNMIQSEDRLDLRHLFFDNFFSFYNFNDHIFMKGKLDFFFLEIIKKVGIISYHFINKKHYQWFKKDEKLKKLFSQYILSKEDLFFSDSLGIGEETIIPQDKAEKGKKLLNKNFNLDESMPQLRRKYEALNNEGQVDNLDSVLESLFLSTLIFTLTKFVYSKEIFITKLYRDNKKSTDLFERITFAYDVDTSIVCQNFLRDVKKYDMKVMEYRDYFQDCFKDYNDVIFPDFQFYYKKSGDDFREIEVPESNFTVIFDDYIIKIFYNSNLYSEKMVHLFYNSLLMILNGFLNENKLLKDIGIGLGIDEIIKKEVDKFIEPEQLLNKLFEKVVIQNRDKIALIAFDRSLTFDELNREANKIANNLIKNGLNIEDRVIISLDRDSHLIVTIIGVIKAGGAFIISTPNPKERLNFIKDDTQAKFIIDKGNIEDFLEEIDDINPNVNINPNNIFSIVYTSGSTGKPNGVMLTHKSLFRFDGSNTLFLHYIKNQDVSKICLLFNQAFVGFLIHVFESLFNGFTLVLPTEEEFLNPNKLIELFKKCEFDCMITTPSLLEFLIENKTFFKILDEIIAILIGGEKPSNNLIRIKERVQLFNAYGSTEVFGNGNTSKLIDSSHIGKPNSSCIELIVDIDGNPLPSGIIGELWIGGLTVAKGYWNNTELTNERFTTISSSSINDIPFFKTGDLAKYDENDGFNLIGRIDNQIKINGQRIDPGEIENNVPDDIGVEKAIVTVNDYRNDNQVLALYFTTKSKSLMNDEIVKIREMIKGHLVDKLPAFMVPQNYVYLEEFPKTSTGKVNVKDLKDYDDNIKEIVKPSTDLEWELFDLCVGLLGCDGFGVTNSLISIGFTSLSIIRLLNKILEKYQVELELFTIVNKDINIRSLSKLIEKYSIKTVSKLIREDENLIPVKHEREYYSLPHNQYIYYRSYYEPLKDLEANNTSLDTNMFFLLKFNKDFDPFKLKDALIKTIDLNYYIKTSFLWIDEKLYQKANKDYKVNINIHNEKLTDQIKIDFVKRFNIFKPPLFRFEIYYYKENVNLLVNIDHLIVDRYSIDIFLNDLIKIYKGNKIIDKKYDFFDYSLDCLEMKLKGGKKYFFKDQLDIFPLGEYRKPLIRKSKHERKMKETTIDKKAIEKFSIENNIFKSTLFLVIISIALKQLLNTENILINMLYNGRFNIKYSETFGIFRSLIPIFLKINQSDQVKKYIFNTQYLITSSINEYSKFNYSPDLLLKDLNPKIVYQYLGSYGSGEGDYSSSESIIPIDKQLNEFKELFKERLELVILEFGSCFKLLIMYDTIYYPDNKINNLISDIELILEKIIENPSKKIIDLL